MRIFVVLAFAMTLLAPSIVAQKPPAPAPQPQPQPPASTLPGRATTIAPGNTDPSESREDLVMFLRGRVVTHDGSPLPNDVLIERVCSNTVRQEVYASLKGDFSMQLGSRNGSYREASVDPYGTHKDSDMGISRRELTNCELRASASGFHPRAISLVDLDRFGNNIDVGVIVVQRGVKIEGTTLSAIPYKAPKAARKAYEKGVQAEKNGNLADAHKYLETAVEIYPSSANAWFQLGTVLLKENQVEAARKAYTQATTIDTKFLPPYLSLASMAYQTENWKEVLDLTGHILELDPLNHAAVSNYILDLDPVNYAGAYFYNAVANYRLNKFEAAEKSALKAEHLDLVTHFPQLHLLLSEIFVRKNDYALAIAEIQTYLALAPNGSDAEQAREQLAKLEKLNATSAN
jgi:tetratricopeptide (TPR) repeat protein